MLFLDKGLMSASAEEAATRPADVILTVDIGRLSARTCRHRPADQSPASRQGDPAAYREPDGNWFGLTTRARVVYASKERVKQDAITYEELADPEMEGQDLHPLRPASSTTIALIASMIAHHGAE